jgi:hypothetical protein
MLFFFFHKAAYTLNYSFIKPNQDSSYVQIYDPQKPPELFSRLYLFVLVTLVM